MSHSGMVQSAGSSGGPANNQGGRNTQPPSKYPPMQQSHQAQHVQPPSNHNVPPQHRTNTQPPAPPQLRPAGPGVFPYAPRGLTQPDMKSGPGHVANPGTHPHQAGVPMSPYNTLPMTVPPILPHSQSMLTQPRNLFMMRGQPAGYNACSNIQGRMPNPQVNMPPSASFVPRQPIFTHLPGNQGYPQSYFISQNAQMGTNMTPPPMMNPSQPAQHTLPKRQSKAIQIIHPETREEVLGSQRRNSSGPPAPAAVVVIQPSIGGMPMPVAGAPIAGAPPPTNPVYVQGSPGMPHPIPVMEPEQPPKAPIPPQEAVMVDVATKRENTSSRHSPAPQIGPSLSSVAAASSLVSSSPPPVVPSKISPASAPKPNAADPQLVEIPKEPSAKQNAARENVPQSHKEPPSSSSTSGARSPMTNSPTAKKAPSPPSTASTTSSSAVGSGNEATSADGAQGCVAHKAPPSADAIRTKSNQARGDTEPPRGARMSRGANVAPPPAAMAAPAPVLPPAPEAPVEPAQEVPSVASVPVTTGRVDSNSTKSVPSVADDDEERRKVEERNEENLRKSQEATKHDSSSSSSTQSTPVQENSTAPVAAEPEVVEAATPSAPTREEPKPSVEDVKPPVEEPREEVAEPSKETAPQSPPATTVTAAGEVKNVEPPVPSSPKAASDTTLEEGEVVSDEGEPEPAATGPGHMYKPGQWSPSCPDGKKQYDREFLLKLQSRPLSMNPPSEMPILDIFKETSHRHTLPPTPGLSHASASLDGYNQRNGQRPGVGPMHRNKPSQMRNASDRQAKKIITLSSSTNEDVKLHVAENAWKPVKEQNADSDAALYKKFRGILNKLTPQKFSALLDQVKQLEINTEERLSNVTNLVLEKALNETHFASTYAKLCHTLLTEFQITKKDPDTSGSQTVNFRKMLLQKCQHEFERDTDDSDESRKREKIQEEERKKQLESCENEQQRKELQESFDEHDMKAKRRTLGLMRFIGELYNLSILNFQIMQDCFLKLLKNPTDEDSIVCACKLFTTVGKKLNEDIKNCTKEPEKAKMMKEKYDELMVKLKKIITDNRDAQKNHRVHLPQRVIFMLEDVWELKMRAWIPRRDEQAPKTLDQIQKEAENEKILANLPQGPSGGGSSGGNARYNSMPNDRNRRGYGNQSQGSGQSYKATKDMLGQIKLPLNSGPFNAGRVAAPNWVAGASGGGSRNSSLRGSSRLDNNDSSPNMNSMNKFELLNTDASDHPVRSQESSPSRAHDRERVRDREAAIQGARTLSHYGNNRAQSGPRSSAPTSRTPSLSGPTVPGTTYSLLGKNEDNEDQVKRYAATIFAEYLVNANKEDFLHDFCERVHKDNLEQFIAHFIELAIEKPKDLGRLAEAIRELHKARILSIRNFENILKEQLEYAEDIAIDIPKYYEYMADLVSQLVNEMDSISLIRVICDTLGKNSPKLLLPLFKKIKAAGGNGIAAKWKKSGLSIPELVSGASDNDIKLLEEALADLGAASSGSGKSDMTIGELTKRFEAAFAIENAQERDAMLADIIQKAGKDHRITALRACATAILHLGLVESKNHFDQKFVMKRFETIPGPIKDLFTEDISIHALYALQVASTELHHPKDLTLNYLNFVYDHDLVDDTTILKWGDQTKTDTKHEPVGYHMTVQLANKFLEWLRSEDTQQNN